MTRSVRPFLCGLAATLLVVSGCTTVAPVASPQPSPAPSVVPSVILIATPAPLVLPTELPSSVLPTVAPSEVPKPTKSAKPSAAAAPDLVVGKLVVGVDPWLAKTDTPLTVTVKNIGTADAAKFVVGAEADSASAQNYLADQDIPSLAAGASSEVTFTLNVGEAGDYTMKATVDKYDDVSELSESDNTKSLNATAVSLPNLYVDGSLFVNPPAAGSSSYEVDFTIGNNGSADAPDPVVKLFAYDSADNQVDLGSHQLPFALAAGQKKDLSYDVQFPASGDYKLYVLLDPDNAIDESDETDNEAEADVTVP